jgi:DNA-binding IclR family transcriptional regulator
MNPDQSSIVKSVSRVFEILELFDVTRVAMTAASISRELKYPPSTTIGLLKSMVELGYLSFDTINFTYIPTMRLLLTSNWVQNLVSCERDIFTIMNDIQEDCGETVMLCCENNGQMQALHTVPGRRPLSDARAGAYFSIFHNVIGHTALSRRSDYEIVQMAQKIARRPGARQKLNLPRIMQNVREIRTVNYGVDYHPDDRTVRILAWPVPSRLRDFPLVLSIGGPAERITAEQDSLVALLRASMTRRPRIVESGAAAGCAGVASPP